MTESQPEPEVRMTHWISYAAREAAKDANEAMAIGATDDGDAGIVADWSHWLELWKAIFEVRTRPAVSS